MKSKVSSSNLIQGNGDVSLNISDDKYKESIEKMKLLRADHFTERSTSSSSRLSDSLSSSKSSSFKSNYSLASLLSTDNHHHLSFMKISSALFYGFSSFFIIVVNKIVLTNYGFPSFHLLGVGQMIATIFILEFGRTIKIISYPNFSREVPKRIFPLPLFYLGNLICGLGGTKRLNLPMFTVLRRFTILMTLIGEYLILRIHQSFQVILTIVAMVGGALVAASNDLTFDLEGYAYVLGNDFFTAANGVVMKKKLDSRDLGKYGLLYYNSLFMIVPLFLLSWISGDFVKVSSFEYWTNIKFLAAFTFSCVMGFLLMYSTVLCTAYNSALTTTIVGCLKNILVTYIGMYIGGDYIFSVTNFIGLNISMVGSLVYSYYTFIEQEHKKIPQNQMLKK